MRSIRLAVEKVTEGKDLVGAVTQTWTTEFYIIGEVKALRGYEQLRGMSMETSVTHRITTHYDSRLTEQKRLRYGSSIYNILFVENVNMQNRKMILTVEQIEYGS